jgi:protein-arginine kinase activator protein McsA
MNNYSLHDLEALLQNAIEREDYMMASVYRDEIKKRKDE